MHSNAPLALALTTFASPAAASGISLNPFDGAVQFAPHSPVTVEPDHPLSQSVVFDAIANAPEKSGGILNTFFRAKELNQALAAGISSAGMAARNPDAARFRLTATWIAFESPFKISFSSRATATLRYELRRVDSGAVIFQRDVTTSAEASGGNAAERQRGTARATVAANFAGMIWCLEEAAYARAPENCAVSPVGSFSAPVTIYIPR